MVFDPNYKKIPQFPFGHQNRDQYVILQLVKVELLVANTALTIPAMFIFTPCSSYSSKCNKLTFFFSNLFLLCSNGDFAR